MKREDEKRLEIVDPQSLLGRMIALGDGGGRPRGQSTGWENLDALWSVGQTQLTIVTGMPGSGKSTWLNALLVNLAERDNWLFAMYSPESGTEEEHGLALVDLRLRKPHRAGPTRTSTPAERREASMWVLQHFLWLDTELRSPEVLLEAAMQFAVLPGRKLGVVLDPWNALDHERMGLSETDYISYTLAKALRLIKANKAHVFLVVHPTKIGKDPADGKRGAPHPYDLHGSAHWFNKADNILVVHRQKVPETQAVEIHVAKVRQKHIGRLGVADLLFDRVTGRYFDAPLGELMVDRLTGQAERYADPQAGCEPPAPVVMAMREPGEDDV